MPLSMRLRMLLFLPIMATINVPLVGILTALGMNCTLCTAMAVTAALLADRIRGDGAVVRLIVGGLMVIVVVISTSSIFVLMIIFFKCTALVGVVVCFV